MKRGYKTIEHNDGRDQRVRIRTSVRGRARLKPSTGPGSYDAENEMRALIRDHRPQEALALGDAHNRVRGCPGVKKMGLWMEHFRAGDDRAAT